jgi:hypothetical protein
MNNGAKVIEKPGKALYAFLVTQPGRVAKLLVSLIAYEGSIAPGAAL